MSSEDNAQIGTSADVGARLRAARKAQQISLREIAATTKISVSALEAIEANDVAQLPGGIFTRAFVQSFAAEVGLDPDQTMRDFVATELAEGIEEDTKHDTWSHEPDVFQSQQRMAGTVLKLLVVGVPVALALLYLGLRDAPTGTEPTAPPAAEVAATARVEAPIRPGPWVPAETVAQESLTIVLRPRADCWVSLTIDGEFVFSRVIRAGERESYEAEEEIILNVGDAGAFAFAINQQAGRSLGAAGEVVTARITHQDYRNYVAP